MEKNIVIAEKPSISRPKADPEFVYHEFRIFSGGTPRNKIGLTPVSESSKFAYDTCANGPAYAGSTVIFCRFIGRTYHKKDDVYITPEGVMFYYHSWRGSPSSFDGGEFRLPDDEIIWV